MGGEPIENEVGSDEPSAAGYKNSHESKPSNTRSEYQTSRTKGGLSINACFPE